jgi:hypothetical protein
MIVEPIKEYFYQYSMSKDMILCKNGITGNLIKPPECFLAGTRLVRKDETRNPAGFAT